MMRRLLNVMAPTLAAILLLVAALSAAWTSPRTWSTNELVTAALLNTHLRDNLLAVFPAGESWTAVAHAGGNFTVPSGSITIASGDQTTFRYHRIGKTLHVQLGIATGTITGTPAYVSVVIPGSYTAAAAEQYGAHWYQDNATNDSGFVIIPSGGTTMRFYLRAQGNWQAQTDLLYIRASLAFEVA